MRKENIPSEVYFNSDYEHCNTVIVGVPYDGTASYRPGARFGPQATRQELYGFETYSPYQDKDLKDKKLHDLGDIELPFGNSKEVLSIIKTKYSNILADGKKILTIGGEHLISLPIIEKYIDKYKDLIVIQLDAHADLRDDYLGEKLSHATVIRRVYDFLGDGRIYQLGIRSGMREEFQFANEHTNMCRYNLSRLIDMIDEIGNKPVYLTIDLDVLDPSIFCGTGTPEPGGINFKELMDGLMQMDKLNIVGGDIVELSPHYDMSGVSTAVACKVLREMLLIIE